jgi:hypothetical protein
MDSPKEAHGTIQLSFLKHLAWEFFNTLLKENKDNIITNFVRACRKIIQSSNGKLPKISSRSPLETTMQGLNALLDDNINYLLKKLSEDESILNGRSNLSLEVEFHGVLSDIYSLLTTFSRAI